LIKVSSVNVTVGDAVFEKSIFPIPLDSTEFNIPSLSWSKSILSMIPSLSKSTGQRLIGISDDKYSTVSPSHSTIPFTLYVPVSAGI
jgi:hypothetical protein